MQETSIDVLEVYRTQGGHAALKALNNYVDRPLGSWGKKGIGDLERWAVTFGNHKVWPLAVLTWIALLIILKAGGEEEKRAYFLNDLGTAFFLSLDPRCFQCFFKALRLTKSPGRRMRTLHRYGNAAAIVTRDYERARRCFRAAIFVGERYRLNPRQVNEIKESLKELERHLPGGKPLEELSVAPHYFEAIRRDIEGKRDPALMDMLRDLEFERL